MPLHSPFEFFTQWHLTERCNLRCRHCYQTGVGSEELSPSEVRKGIDEIAEAVRGWSDLYGLEILPSFSITGGEPFLRSDIEDIHEYIRNIGIDVFILSNGILINEKRALRLARIGVKGVQVSLEGPEEIHEDLRGKGSFSAAIEGVKTLHGAGLEVTLNVTLSDINVDRFMEMVTLASSLGVPRLGFSRLVPYGRGADLLCHMLDKAKVKKIYERIFSLQVGDLTIVTGDPIAINMRGPREEEDNDVPRGGCAAGLSGITILPDGTMLPCRRLPVPIGNIMKDSFREVWASSPVLCRLRDRKAYGGKCGRCAHWATCRGCRAIAYAYARSMGRDDFLAEDPQCFIDA